MSLEAGAQRLIDMVRASNRPPVESTPPEAARAAVRNAQALLGGTPIEIASIRDHLIPGPGGPIAIRVYRPVDISTHRNLPTLLFLHGGGWVVGDLDTHDLLCRALARAACCQVIAVNYRLAPEHRFPAALDDAKASMDYLAQHAKEFGIDLLKYGVGGDSAGGNLAAVLALMSRDGDLPPLSLQLLLYPICDLGMMHASYARNGDGYLLTRSSMEYFICSYISTPLDVADWRASPLRAGTLAGVAPSFVLTAGYDPLCDEGGAYAERLLSAGVPTEHVRLEGQIHGFLTAGAIITEAASTIEAIGAYLRSRWQI